MKHDLIRRLRTVSDSLKLAHSLGFMAGSRPLNFETIDEAIVALSTPRDEPSEVCDDFGPIPVRLPHPRGSAWLLGDD